jgi:citrate synthase
MMTTQTIFSPDLAGIEVGETSISNVDGEAGILSYRGHPIEDLVDKPFMQVVWQVLFGTEPSAEELGGLEGFMATHSKLNSNEQAVLSALPKDLHPMLMLQTMVPMLGLTPTGELSGLSATAHSGLIIAAKLPSLIASWRQLELGNSVVTSNSCDNFHENFLTMFNGATPTDNQTKVLDAAQILQMEHSFNAGTFAGRVCASTLAPIQSSIAASIGTLFGVLHGGADQAALEMAETIGSPELAASYVEKCLTEKTKIMGMGHREYKVVDPRANILKPMAAKLCDSGDAKRLFDTLVAVETECNKAFSAKGKEIWANVEFYKGAVFYQLGVPPRYFTALFAMARVYGYIAHYLEFSENSKLIRPRARYVSK